MDNQLLQQLFKLQDFRFITELNGVNHLKQEQALNQLTDNVHTEILFGGSAGGSKSWTGCTWLAFSAMIYPDTKWYIGREELKRLRESTLITFFKVCKTYGIE